LPLPVRQAISGNVGTLIAFRIGQGDAEWLEPYFVPLNYQDLTNIPKYHYHIRTLVGGVLTTPFTVQSLPVTIKNQSLIEAAIRKRVRTFSELYTKTA
jgi:hypothetical protein